MKKQNQPQCQADFHLLAFSLFLASINTYTQRALLCPFKARTPGQALPWLCEELTLARTFRKMSWAPRRNLKGSSTGGRELVPLPLNSAQSSTGSSLLDHTGLPHCWDGVAFTSEGWPTSWHLVHPPPLIKSSSPQVTKSTSEPWPPNPLTTYQEVIQIQSLIRSYVHLMYIHVYFDNVRKVLHLAKPIEVSPL